MNLHATLILLLSMAVVLLMVLGFRRYSEQRRREMFVNHRRGRIVFDLTDHHDSEDSAGTHPA